jgi:glycosyl transferase family 25
MSDSVFRNLVGPIFVINLPHRIDRWEECVVEFEKIGLKIEDVYRFPAIYSEIHGGIGAAYSHASVLMKFMTDYSEPHCLILEDDFKFVRPVADVIADIEVFLNQVDVWHALLLSGSEVFSFVTENPKFVRVYESLTASAYIVKREAVPNLIERFLIGAEKLKSILPVLNRNNWFEIISRYSLDVMWHELQMKQSWFMMNPRMVIQRPSFSDIMNEVVDYKV